MVIDTFYELLEALSGVVYDNIIDVIHYKKSIDKVNRADIGIRKLYLLYLSWLTYDSEFWIMQKELLVRFEK